MNSIAKKIFYASGLIALLLLAPQAVKTAGAQVASAAHTLCLPAVYEQPPEDCLPFGPSQNLRELAESNIPLPVQPLEASRPSPELATLPYVYGRVTADEGFIYASLQDAVDRNDPVRTIEPGFNYVSYIDVAVVDGRNYYMLTPTEWMRGGQLASNAATSRFMGLEFSSTPRTKFGWVLHPVVSKHSPGLSAEDYTGREFAREDVVQVYDTVEASGLLWHLIGPGEWLEARHVGLVYPNPVPPEGVTNGRWIEINLFEQTVAVYENSQLVYATLVATGSAGFWTRPGLFQITEKLESTPMTGAFEADRSDFYYLEDVPWTMYFDQARALHGAYWHNSFGYKQSHGCVNLSPADSQWLYNWGNIGDWVYVWDPSGETPTDPSLYGAGGA
jgi:hypothetical protein